MNWRVVIAIVLGMVLLRFFKPNMLVWLSAWAIGLYVFMRFGFATPVPGSVIKLYMGVSLLALFAYATSSEERREGTFGPLVRLATERRHTPLLVLIVVALPLLVAFNVYRSMNVPLEAPSFGRTVHPSPPDSITVHDNTINLITGDNPFRALQTTNPEEFRRRVESGREIYYRNCHYCHGDNMGGNGMFAHGLNPIPTNFTDQGVLPNFQESFFFWRIAKGAPGLPDEGGPWDSAMPAWESFLSEEQIWEVILFLYDFNGYQPRALGHEVHE